jgi:hypothetical protein
VRNIILIACVKSKLGHPAQAKDLYISTLFKSNLAYAKSLKPDAIYILSAKHGLLELDQVIAPYEMTLNKISESEKKTWAKQVLADLSCKADLQKDQFIFLAGINYRKYLVSTLKNVDVPLEGLSFGQQLQELKRRTS